MPRLTLEILQENETRSVTFSLTETKEKDLIIIGRDRQNCDLVLQDKRISRIHGKIWFQEIESTFYLQNLTYERPRDQPNPIWVNNSLVMKEKIALFKDTQIKLGKVLLKVVAVDIPQNGIECINGHTVPYTYQGYFCPHCGSFLESGNTVVASSYQFSNLEGENNASRN